MVKKKYEKKSYTKEILIAIIVILVLTNIITLVCTLSVKENEPVIEQVLYTKVEGKYKKDKKYYSNLKYSKFKKLLKKDTISTIAVVDKSSKNYKKFKELVNKTSFYTSTKMYLLETSKLSKKNEIAFYNVDDRLKELETNYIITISNNKIVAITTFDNSELNKILEGFGE